MHRVIVVDRVTERADFLRQALGREGHEVIAVLSSSAELPGLIDSPEPEFVLAVTQSPGRDTIEDIRLMMQRRPCPVVMYAGSRDPVSIARATDAGVSAYVTGDIETKDVRCILDVASARFRQFRAIRDELQEARQQLENRRLLDRAKALLIKHHGLDESIVHRSLQQMAMNQRISLTDAARRVIAMLSALPEEKPKPQD